tara:strand:+ start:1238 stop:1465 length:228 start_codon:yes stop_codon:yes gene_type:complete
MQAIIFITLSIIILCFILFLGIRAIQKGINSKNNQNLIKESSNNISEELLKLNELLKSGAITKEEFLKAKKKILD